MDNNGNLKKKTIDNHLVETCHGREGVEFGEVVKCAMWGGGRGTRVGDEGGGGRGMMGGGMRRRRKKEDRARREGEGEWGMRGRKEGGREGRRGE